MRVEKTFEIRSAEPMARDEAMAKINAIAGRTIDPDSVFIGRMILSDDRYDRSFERIPASYQERFAATLPGKPVLTAHAKQQPAVGRFFAASVHWEDGGAVQTMADYYLPARSDLAERVKLGIAKEVSVAFMAAGRECDLCKAPYDGPMSKCPHIAGKAYGSGQVCTLTYSGNTERVEALEGSFVGIGANPGAQTMSMATGYTVKEWAPGGGVVVEGDGDALPPKETEVNEKEYQDRIQTLEDELKAQKAAAGELTTKVAELEPKAKEGEAARVEAIDEYVRLTNIVAKSDDAAAPMLEFLMTASMSQIKALTKTKKAELDQMYPPSPQSKLLDAGATPKPSPDGKQKPPERFDPFASYRGGL